MNTETVIINGKAAVIPFETYDAVVVGTGAAGYNAAHTLATLAPEGFRFCVVTEGINMGTSRNTGSDKQTYFKPSAEADVRDSAADMARALMEGGSMHGDLALTEAAYANRCFYKLVALGVPFPHDEYGCYSGYRTDHDVTGGRATSCGPLTSKYMTEALQRACEKEGVAVFDKCRAVELATEGQRVRGVYVLDGGGDTYNDYGLRLFKTPAVIWATGGAGGIYAETVYPESQSCALGVPMTAGARAVNMTEWQYGVASVKFRWNLSGSYQQAVPRYFSVGADGSEREFLSPLYGSVAELSENVFLKGYEWPFDAAKIYKNGKRGSSSVDLAVFAEREAGRRVYMDFRRNPSGVNSAADLGETARAYLSTADALGDIPIERLRRLNERAVRLYLDHGIDLEREPVEIAVCAQHCNGGIEGNTRYESVTLGGLYAAGEVNGVFGVKRPGGSALNSTQVSSTAAAEAIISAYRRNGRESENGGFTPPTEKTLRLLSNCRFSGGESVPEIRERIKRAAERMSASCSFLRRSGVIDSAILATRGELRESEDIAVYGADALRELFIYRDILITQLAVLTAAADYISAGGKSRGSFAVTEKSAAELLEAREPLETDTENAAFVRSVRADADGEVVTGVERTRPIPRTGIVFERLLADFMREREGM